MNTIPDFFFYKGVPCRPFAAVSNQEASKILGSSIDPNGDYILHYYETDGKTEFLDSNPCNFLLPKASEIKAIEVSSSGNVLFLAGVAAQSRKSIITAVEFNRNLTPICTLALDDIDYGKPRRLKRIRGYDILLLGCKSHYAVLDFSNFTFDFLGNVEKVNKSEIVDFEFRNGVLYSKGYKEKSISIIDFEEGYKNMIDKVNSPLREPSPPVIRSGIVSDYEPPKPIEGDERGGGSFGEGNRGDPRAYDPRSNQYRVERIRADFDSIEKVRVANDKRRIYVGGKGLGILQVRNTGEYEMLNAPNLKSKGIFFIYIYFVDFFVFFFGGFN